MGIAEYYYDLLKKSDNKIIILVNFYRSLFEIEEVPKDFYARIGRIIKIYGEDITFFSILDCSDVNNISHDNPYGLIIYFAKKRLVDKYNSYPVSDLSKVASRNIEFMQKKRRIKIPEIINE